MTSETEQHPIVPALQCVATAMSLLAVVILVITIYERFRG